MECCDLQQFFDDVHSMAQSLRAIAASLLPSPAYGSAHGVLSVALPPLYVEGIDMSVVIKAGTEGDVVVRWVDDYGNPARVDGDTKWQSSDEKAATVSALRPDSTRAHVKSLGPIGPVQIQATADADMGEGRKTITAILNVNVIAGEAGGGEIGPDDGDDVPDNTLPGAPARPDNSLPGSQPGIDNTLPPPYPGAPAQRPPRVDNTLPGLPARPDNSLPGSQPGIDNALPPGLPARPDNSLPGSQPGIDNALPPGLPARPDNALPGSQPGIDNALPGVPARPGNALPPAPEPKGVIRPRTGGPLGGRK